MNKNWSREELVVAFNLYCTVPFSKIGYKNKQVIELARLIGRTPSAVALKLVNFARLDPELQKRNIAGMSHGSKAEVGIWNEFHEDWENLAYTSETILAGYKNTTVEESAAIPTDDLPREGKERESVVKTRVTQSFFRKTILASYEYRCCITGITIPDLLVASHIVPWAEDAKNRLNPHNGLCLNALHDKAFDRFLITITEDFRVKIADILKTDNPVNRTFFIPYDNMQITLPQRFRPAGEFLRRHFGEFTGTKEVNSKQLSVRETIGRD